jgi:hypothetical protein
MAQDARVTLRLPADVLKRVRRVAEAMTKAGRGFAYGEADVMRAAIVRGLDALERELRK